MLIPKKRFKTGDKTTTTTTPRPQKRTVVFLEKICFQTCHEACSTVSVSTSWRWFSCCWGCTFCSIASHLHKPNMFSPFNKRIWAPPKKIIYSGMQLLTFSPNKPGFLYRKSQWHTTKMSNSRPNKCKDTIHVVLGALMNNQSNYFIVSHIPPCHM